MRIRELLFPILTYDDDEDLTPIQPSTHYTLDDENLTPHQQPSTHYTLSTFDENLTPHQQPSTHYTLSTFENDETKDRFSSNRKQCDKTNQFSSNRKQCANVDTNKAIAQKWLEQAREIKKKKDAKNNVIQTFKIARKSGKITKLTAADDIETFKIERESGKITKLTAADRGTGSRKRCIKQSANKKFESYTNKMKSKSRSPKKNIIFLRKSNHPDKKLMVTIGNKTIYFGAKNYSDYNKHKDKLRMLRYSNRHRLRENWGKSGIKTAGFWSKWILWNKPGLLASIKDTEKRFNICINYV
jgi:hypothetical protein